MLDNSQNNNICVFGLGQSGLSVARYLQKNNQSFFIVDSRENPPGKDLTNELTCCHSHYFGVIPAEKLNTASLIILSPGISPQIAAIQAAKANGVKVIGDVELFVTQTKKKIVAITGSNGKSTVTDLTYQLLIAAGFNAKIGGNFGVPVLDYLPEDDADIYVLELSSFQLDTTSSLKAEVAVVLNITEDHMDRYNNFNDYLVSKLSICSGAKKIIVNADDQLTYKNLQVPCEKFSLQDLKAKYHLVINETDKNLVCDGYSVVNAKALSLTGKHNWANVLAALAVLVELDIELSAPVLACLKNYQGLQHRFQLVKRTNNIDWINDSKATNVGATQAALNSIDLQHYSAIVLIAGGDAKGADLSPLKSSLAESVSLMILIGKDAALLATLLPQDKVSFATDMKDAVSQAKIFVENISSNSLNNNYLVLLSPACASLDMYKNFEYRGRAFVDAVEECA